MLLHGTGVKGSGAQRRHAIVPAEGRKALLGLPTPERHDQRFTGAEMNSRVAVMTAAAFGRFTQSPSGRGPATVRAR